MTEAPESKWLVLIGEVEGEHPDMTFELEESEEEDWLVVHITDGQRRERFQISLRLTDDVLEEHVRAQLQLNVQVFRKANDES